MEKRRLLSTNISGSVEVLMLSTKFIDKAKDEGTYSELNELIRVCEQLEFKLVNIKVKMSQEKF